MGGIVSSEEEQGLLDVNVWVVEQGLPEGMFSYELVDESTGELKVILDLAWPAGIQEGYSQPVVLLIDEDLEVEKEVNQAGYRFFTSAEEILCAERDTVVTVSHTYNTIFSSSTSTRYVRTRSWGS